MKIVKGYIYHIKDEFFKVVNDEHLMSNHELGKARPTYFVIKDNDILWFIPLSSKVDKYKRIVNDKITKYGNCKTILIRNILGKETAILIQNAFPTLEKYIDHIHLTTNKKPARVIETLCIEIEDNFKTLISMKEHGIDLFFADIDKIKDIMLNELETIKN